jgi:hypothetical protein
MAGDSYLCPGSGFVSDFYRAFETLQIVCLFYHCRGGLFFVCTEVIHKA